jgi:dynein heavy chain
LADKNRKKFLFTIDLKKNNDETDFVYSTNPKNFITLLLEIYEKTIEEGNKIPDIEPSILSDLFKSNKNETFIKSPIKTKEKP